tara:strand:+ start:2467 stop:3762 length:1296 start_codon:yes stop_codon:yes gene_type:complete
MRSLFVALHRWAGLFTAAFLFLSGATGAVISWDHELDEWLNADLTKTTSSGPALPTLAIVQEVEARHPAIKVSYVPLAAEPGHALSFFVEPRVDEATGELFDVDYNQVFVDPVTGAELGTREWGSVWPITRKNVVSFLYVLHYSLHMPEMFGIERWGVWLMGVVALIWTIDCFTGFYLTLPLRRRARVNTGLAHDTSADQRVKSEGLGGEAKRSSWLQRWAPAWKIRWRGGSYKLNFDLHRAFSLWTWGLLLVIAFTAFSLNLYREMFFPAMSLVSDVTPSIFDLRERVPDEQAPPPQLDFAAALERSDILARNKGWQEPPGAIFYARNFGVYGVEFFYPQDGHGAGGAGHRTVHIDAQDGRELGVYEPWQGTVADLFVQAQFPVHSGRILGLPGRILISVMGVVIAMLSVTGVIIWWRKRGAKNGRARIG